MASNNPFAIIGLSPDAMRGLSNAQIKKVIKNLVRGLQSVHHEDVGGKPGKMSEINVAVDALSDPKAFDRYKKKYLHKSPQKKKISELENQLRETEKASLEEANRLWAYITTLTGHNIYEGATIVSARNVYVSDDVTQIKRRFLRGTDWHKMDSQIEAYTFYRMSIETGVLTKEFLQQSSPTSPVEIFLTRNESSDERVIVGCLSESEIRKLGGRESVLFLLQGAREIPNEGIAKLSGLARDRIITNEYHVDNFKVILPLLSPEITIGGMLFSLVINPNGLNHIEYDGRVVNRPINISKYGWL
tara:strand:- start:881 stop:1789 length:909 start_codon:yes stop_codon:yes gene_type:complete